MNGIVAQSKNYPLGVNTMIVLQNIANTLNFLEPHRPLIRLYMDFFTFENTATGFSGNTPR